MFMKKKPGLIPHMETKSGRFPRIGEKSYQIETQNTLAYLFHLLEAFKFTLERDKISQPLGSQTQLESTFLLTLIKFIFEMERAHDRNVIFPYFVTFIKTRGLYLFEICS